MKVLTLRDPWAQLVVSGVKDVENRTWETKHRGPLAIHLGAKKYEDSRDQARIIMDALGLSLSDFVTDDFPLGHIIGTVELVSAERKSSSPWAMQGAHMRYWVFENSRLIQPIPARGNQGLWEHDV